MTNLNKYDWAFILGIAFWLCSTAYFGWNKEAVSVQEEMANQVSMVFILFGAIGSFFTNLKPQVTVEMHNFIPPDAATKTKIVEFVRSLDADAPRTKE